MLTRNIFLIAIAVMITSGISGCGSKYLMPGLAEMHDLKNRFLEHMDRWVSKFVDRIHEAPSRHPAIGYAARRLAECLKR